jgi:hypothetical protein
MSRTKIGLNIALLVDTIWVAAADLCLARRAPSIHSPEMGTLVFALCLQLGAVAVLWTIVNHHLAISQIPASSRIKFAFLIVPLFLLWLSRDMVAGALYNVGSTDKIANGKRTDTALDCCISISDLIAGIGRHR